MSLCPLRHGVLKTGISKGLTWDAPVSFMAASTVDATRSRYLECRRHGRKKRVRRGRDTRAPCKPRVGACTHLSDHALAMATAWPVGV